MDHAQRKRHKFDHKLRLKKRDKRDSRHRKWSAASDASLGDIDISGAFDQRRGDEGLEALRRSHRVAEGGADDGDGEGGGGDGGGGGEDGGAAPALGARFEVARRTRRIPAETVPLPEEDGEGR